jgi:hypothetical protein
MLRIRHRILPLALSALFAASSVTSILATRAANPATSSSASGMLSDSAQAASAQGYPYHRHGYYRWHGRYWAHRTWHRGYWGPGHRWQPGVWVYF